jgi:long-chain acyl-CoA synthetase
VTLPDSLRGLTAAVARRGDRPALVWMERDGREELSCAALADQAARLAGGLRDAGLEPGERVLLLAPGSPAWVIACLALLEAGAVPVPVDSQAAGSDLAHILDNSRARWAFTAERLAARLEEASGDTDPPRLVLLDGDEASERHFARLLGGPKTPGAEVEPGDEAVLFYTSGTSGRPKGVPLTHANLLSNLGAILAEGLVDGGDRLLLPLPLHHVYPFALGMLAPLILGLPVVLPYSLTGPQLARALEQGECTVVLGIPRLYAALFSAIEGRVAARGRIVWVLLGSALELIVNVAGNPGRRLFAPLRRRVAPRLRLLISGGAPLDPDLARRLKALGWDLASGYGLTETSPILTVNPPEAYRPEAAGRALAGVDLRVSGDRGERGEGEVLARGPNVFAGYLDLPEKTADAFTPDGWFRTGDLGRLDADGWLYLTGRASARIVLPGGENVDPAQVEERLAGCPSVREAGVLERDGGLAAVVVPETAAARGTSGEALEERLRAEIAEASRDAPSHQQVGTIRIDRSPLARTRLGKLRRHLLRERFDALPEHGAADEPEAGLAAPEDLAPEDRQLLEAPVTHRLWAWLGERFEGRRITPDTNLRLDLDVDSLEWVELTLDLERRLGLALEEEAIGRVETVRDLLREGMDAGQASAEGSDTAARLRDPEALLDEDQRRWVEPPGPLGRGLAALLHPLARGAVRLLMRPSTSGVEHLPPEGPCILASNHLSAADPAAILAVLTPRQRRVTCWGGWTGLLFHRPWTRAMSRAMRVLPVDPGTGPLTSLALGAAALRRGCILVWFPEGARSPDGRLQAFRPGIGTLAHALAAPIVPAWIQGTEAVLPPGSLRPRPHPVRLRFGAPLDPADLEREGRGDSAAERIADALREHVARLGRDAS